MKVNIHYYDFEKGGVYYKKLPNGTLMVVRCIGFSGELSKAKKTSLSSECNIVDYENIVIPPIVDGMKVATIEECDLLGIVSHMTNISLPETLLSIGRNVIWFNDIVMPSSVTDVFYDLVYICKNLVLPDSLKTIGQMTECHNVMIPASVNRIDKIIGTNILVLESAIPPELLECDPNTDSILVVPKGARKTYEKDPQWGKIKNICEAEGKGMGVDRKQKQENREKKNDHSGTGYVFNGKVYKIKGRLCHDIVKYYVEQNPNAALVTLQRAFNTSTNMIVASPDMAKAIINSDGTPGGDFYMKEEDMIALKKGKVVVWKYWPERYFNPFMEQVKALGYTIEEIEQ